MWDFLANLFSSHSLRKVDFYSLRSKLADWSVHRSYPSYNVLPSVLVFPSEFWTRVTEIARHTVGDGHERAVTVWWADGEFVVTENIRGDTASVNIPENRIAVQYKPLSGTNRAERVITINNDVYSKRSISIYDMNKIKRVEVQYLFHMHTHPPRVDTTTDQHTYALFSSIDLKGFLTSTAAMTGLVTDELWVLAKTNRSPRDFDGEPSLVVTPDMLTSQLGLKVYHAEFGRGAVVVGYPSE
jgi:hypothetical protein